MDDFGQSKYVAGYRCRKCDFDLCINCVLKYGECNINNLTDVELKHAYFVVCSTKLCHMGESEDMDSFPVILKIFEESEAFDLFAKM
jgi:hypothetical protein